MVAVDDAVLGLAVVVGALRLRELLNEKLLHDQNATLPHRYLHQPLPTSGDLAVIPALGHTVDVDDGAVQLDPFVEEVWEDLLLAEVLERKKGIGVKLW